MINNNIKERKGGEMKIEPKLIGKQPEEETYVISMDK